MIDKLKIFGLLGLSARAGKITFGAEAVTEAVFKNKVKLIIIAEDASERTKIKFNELSKNKKIPIFEFATIEELSKSIGKKNKAIIAITDINFSKEIVKKICGGDVIG